MRFQQSLALICSYALADPRGGGARDASSPLGPISLYFMQFSAEIFFNNRFFGPKLGIGTHVLEILDPPLIFSHASTEAERDLSSLSCVCVYVDKNKGTPPKWHIH